MWIFKIIFFAGIFITFYSYLGYGLLLWLWLKIRPSKKKQYLDNREMLPRVTMIVAAYNEENFIEEKIKNTLDLDYPQDKLDIIFITDGSSDRTPDIISHYNKILLLHEDSRRGKIAAIHRAMDFVKTPYVIFSDANAILNKESVLNIIRHYQDPQVGGVAGEKKVMHETSKAAAGVGEGLYWKYESFLKKLDWDFFTVVGAAGELFSVRTELYEHPGNNVILDDLIISLRICQKGYRVAYEPAAFAAETASSSIKEEQKRKVRISAGGFQSIVMLKDLLKIYKYPKLSFQYISHRVLRWTLCPLFLPLVFLANLILVLNHQSFIYSLFFAGQILFYLFAITGWLLSMRNKKISYLYAIYYFVFINISLYKGFFTFLKGRQTVLWEKASREMNLKVN